MASSPIFVCTPRTAVLALTSSATPGDDTTLITAGAQGSRFNAISVHNGHSDVVEVTLRLQSGGAGARATLAKIVIAPDSILSLLDPAVIPSVDPNDPHLVLGAGDVLSVALSVAPDADVTITAFNGGDY